MRAALILAALFAAGPASAQPEPPVARYRVTVVEQTATGGTLTATLTASRRRYTTSWTLECVDAGDRRRPELSTYRGSSVADDRWLEHRGPAGRFTIALGEPRLWMASLPGCPRVGQPRIEPIP